VNSHGVLALFLPFVHGAQSLIAISGYGACQNGGGVVLLRVRGDCALICERLWRLIAPCSGCLSALFLVSAADPSEVFTSSLLVKVLVAPRRDQNCLKPWKVNLSRCVRSYFVYHHHPLFVSCFVSRYQILLMRREKSSSHATPPTIRRKGS